MNPSKSGFGTKVFADNVWFLTLAVCNIMIALRMFLLECFAIDNASATGSSKLSLVAILLKISEISFSLGAGTRTWRHLERRGKITLLRLSQFAIIRQLGINVSIVLLRDAYAV